MDVEHKRLTQSVNHEETFTCKHLDVGRGDTDSAPGGGSSVN